VHNFSLANDPSPYCTKVQYADREISAMCELGLSSVRIPRRERGKERCLAQRPVRKAQARFGFCF
ncbi:MAG TPA: hypothetical protein VGA09_13585, partial [Candidatus Binatia bacterium]